MSVISISAAVGLNATNRYQDVVNIQVMLNHFIGNRKLLGYQPLTLDGKCGPKTREAIMAFQFQNGLVSAEHFQAQVRPGGPTISFMNKNAGYIPPAPAKKLTADEKLIELLWQVDTDSLGRTDRHRKHLGRLRRFFLRALDGDPVDDGYWTFLYYDGIGRAHACFENFFVASVERSKTKKKALADFRVRTVSATDEVAVGTALRKVEETMACHTFVLTRWHHGMSGVGDASIEGYTEMGYLKDVALLAVQTRPECIYFVYADELLTAYPRVMRPIFTPDLRWQQRHAAGVQ